MLQNPRLDQMNVASPYALVIAVAKRARELNDLERESGERHRHPLTRALEEAQTGDLTIQLQNNRNPDNH